ncbi:MAG: cytochrome c [Ilumatobacteraceae bacterium]
MTRVGVGAGCVAAVLAVAAIAVQGTSTVATMATMATRDGSSDGSSDGAQLFQRKGCAACHTGPDSPARLDVAPSLADASSWAASREPGVTARDYLAESMLAPSTFISPELRGAAGPMSGMPDLGLSGEEVDALIDYLLQP